MLACSPLRNLKIDVLYLDNTNCDPEQRLPSREEATEQIKELIKKHPCHDVVIGLYSIGKESLLVDLAKTFRCWIVVSPQRLELLTLLELEDVFSVSSSDGRIRVVEQFEVKCSNMMNWNSIHPTIAILPTSRKVKVWHKDIHVVPYSDHSSYDELIEFVSRLKPSSIIPVVKRKQCISHFQQYMSSQEAARCIEIPDSVRSYMRSRKASSKANTLKLKVSPRQIPRGVEYESIETNLECMDLNETANDSEMIQLKEDFNTDGCNSSLSCETASVPPTESTALGSDTNDNPFSSPTSTICEVSKDVFEMPSAISSPMNVTVISDSSISGEETGQNISLSLSVSSDRTRNDSLSLVPWKKRKKLDSGYFHRQVERYFERSPL
ncbi:hypothetical protein GDO78_008557 [Eleutherodactylus coqui]|nr:hypothetical protein GDO78_008557 [Eleutherodactylus coqui]KAG9485545.1 hypothetical protein GDO78_008557 [Eleutherodactylus coqui]